MKEIRVLLVDDHSLFRAGISSVLANRDDIEVVGEASDGLEGIETYYPSQKKKMQKRIRKFATANDLLLTGGSDYHGDIRPGTRLAGGHNVYVPPELLETMKEHLTQKGTL